METLQKNRKSSWDTYRITFGAYQTYLSQKEARGESRFNLDFTDLLYASNYKGGNGSIQEPEDCLPLKLKLYSDLLNRINQVFGVRQLGELSEDEFNKLDKFIQEMIQLCSKYHIKGLGVAYCSALFHLQFAHLIPVIDRNVLLGLELITLGEVPKSGQVPKIELHYKHLVRNLYEKLYLADSTLRALDKKVFLNGQTLWSEYKIDKRFKSR